MSVDPDPDPDLSRPLDTGFLGRSTLYLVGYPRVNTSVLQVSGVALGVFYLILGLGLYLWSMTQGNVFSF